MAGLDVLTLTRPRRRALSVEGYWPVDPAGGTDMGVSSLIIVKSAFACAVSHLTATPALEVW